MIKIFKQIEVSSKYHSLDQAILDVQLFDDRIVIETLNYSIIVNFDSIAILKNKHKESIEIIVNDSTVLSNIYLTNIQQKDCELLIFRYEVNKKSD